MHSALNRLQTTFGFFTTCAFTLAGIIAVLSLIPIPLPSKQPAARITPRDVQVTKGRANYYSHRKEELAQIRFDLDADLSSLFTWNTKQLFVYVTANYPTSSGNNDEQTESIIWDMIIPAPASPWSLQNLRSVYFPDKKSQRAAKKNKKASAKDKSKSTALSQPGRLNLKNQKPKYSITDPSGHLAEQKNVTLQLSWNVQPWVGALVWDKGYLGSRTGTWKAGRLGTSAGFDLPPLKGSKSEAVKKSAGSKPKGGEALPVNDI